MLILQIYYISVYVLHVYLCSIHKNNMLFTAPHIQFSLSWGQWHVPWEYKTYWDSLAEGAGSFPFPSPFRWPGWESSAHLNDRPHTRPTQDGHLPRVDAVRSVFPGMVHPEYPVHSCPIDIVCDHSRTAQPDTDPSSRSCNASVDSSLLSGQTEIFPLTDTLEQRAQLSSLQVHRQVPSVYCLTCSVFFLKKWIRYQHLTQKIFS